jgi:ribosomal protein S16
VPEDTSQALVAVVLDEPIYAASQDNFADLRLLDQDQVETPYLLKKIASSKTVTQRLSSAVETQNLQKSGENGIVVTLSLDKNAAFANGLTINTQQRNFDYSLQIMGSTDGNDWHILVENATIYDYSRYMAVSNRDISLPDNQDRFLKIIVAEATQTRNSQMLELTRTLQAGTEQQRQEKQQLQYEALHIDGIEVWHNHSNTQAEIAQSFAYPLSTFTISQDSAQHTSLIEIDSKRQPLTGFTLEINTPNFSRSAEVQKAQQGMQAPLQVIGTAQLHALHFQEINQVQTELTFPEQRQPHYRIVIHNQDNPVLDIAKISGIGNGYQLLFLPQAGKHYQLYYGAEKMPQPVYDTASIQEVLGRGYQTTSVSLGPETVLTPIKQKLNISSMLESSWFLGGVIGLMVLVLVWSLFRIVKGLNNLSE